MATKPTELLTGEGLKVGRFNDDVLGRTLDKLYRAGPEAYIHADYFQRIHRVFRTFPSQRYHLNTQRTVGPI
jgi:hypothetical protein